MYLRVPRSSVLPSSNQVNAEEQRVSGSGHSQNGKFTYGYASSPGKRSSMEDFYETRVDGVDGEIVGLFGVFDGHGGARAAEYVKHHLFGNLIKHPKFISDTKSAIADAYNHTDSEFLKSENSQTRDAGSTASTAILVGDRLLVANVGDSRAVICRGGQAIAVSRDHKPDQSDERQRIEDAGGFVIWAGTWRVGGVLAVSRAFGDKLLKQYVVADPEIQEEKVDNSLEFLILASDGLWDVVSNEEAVAMVKPIQDPEEAAKSLMQEASQRGSADNITCVVVMFMGNQGDSSKHHTSNQSDSFKCPTANQSGSSKSLTGNHGDSLELMSGNQGHSSVRLTSNQGDSSKHLSGNQGDSSNWLASNQGDSSKRLSDNQGDSSKHLSGNQGDSSNRLTSNQGDFSKHLSGNQGNPSERLPGYQDDSSRCLSDNQGNSSNRLTGNQGDSSKHLLGNQGDSSKHLSGNQGDSSNRLTSNQGDSSKLLSGNQGDSSNLPTSNQGDSSKHLSGNQGDPSKRLSGNQGDSLNRLTGNQGDSSKHLSNMLGGKQGDCSKSLCGKRADSSRHLTSSPNGSDSSSRLASSQGNSSNNRDSSTNRSVGDSSKIGAQYNF